jgi:hypothetical protein
MNGFRIVVLALAVIQVVITGFTAAVGAFADGGDVWQRLVLVVLHPTCAVALLFLTLQRSPVKVMALAVAGLLFANVAADVALSSAIARGVIKGDSWLPLVFVVIPVVGIVYAMALLVRRPRLAP